LAKARDQLHREAAEASSAKRDSERARRNKKSSVKQIHLQVGDFVLVGRVVGPLTNKATINWLGPRRIVAALSDWLLEVEDLRDGSKTTHHASRLKLFAGPDMDLSQPLLDHIAYV
jgi:hypothetical protein